MLLLSSADFFQNSLFSKKKIHKHFQSVKQFGSRPGFGSKLFEMAISRRHVAASKERKAHEHVGWQ